LLKKPGWNARLAIARLLLLEDLQDTDAAKWMPEVYSWLSTMTSQPVGDNVLLEPLELLGKLYPSFWSDRMYSPFFFQACAMNQALEQAKASLLQWIFTSGPSMYRSVEWIGYKNELALG
jgi:hypothetical protein